VLSDTPIASAIAGWGLPAFAQQNHLNALAPLRIPPPAYPCDDEQRAAAGLLIYII
jgi:hypothetical protein